MPTSLCPVCAARAEIAPLPGDYTDVHCPKCGPFTLSGTAAELLRRRPHVDRAALSQAVRAHPRPPGDGLLINSWTLDSLIVNSA